MEHKITPEVMTQLAKMAANTEVPEELRQCGQTMPDLSKKQLEAQRYSEDFFVLQSSLSPGTIQAVDGMISGFQKLQDIQSDLTFLAGRCIVAWKKWRERHLAEELG